MISVAATIPSAYSAPPGSQPGGADLSSSQTVSVSPTKAIGGRTEDRADGQPLEDRFIRLAASAEAKREGDSSRRPAAAREQSQSDPLAAFFSTPFMTQLISQAIRGMDRPEFDLVPEAGIAAYQQASERGARYYYGLLDPFDVTY